MTRQARHLIAAAFAALACAGASAHSDDAAFDRQVRSYATQPGFKWHNALLPSASGDYLAQSESADAAFDRIAGSLPRSEARWINALAPAASGDYVAVAEATSADDKFMRQIAYYTRDMLDRGGWLNAFIADDHYAAGNRLLAVAVGEGVTSA